MRWVETTTLPIPAGSLPVSLADAKAHARVEVTDDDTLIQTLIGAATRVAEQHTQKRWAPRSFDLYFDNGELVNGGAVCVEQFDSGLTTVGFDAFSDEEPVTTEAIDTDDFDLLGNRLILKNSFPDLTISLRPFDSYRFQYTVLSAPVSDALKQAVKMMVAHWYEHREAVGIQDGFSIANLPLSIIALLQTEKVYSA